MKQRPLREGREGERATASFLGGVRGSTTKWGDLKWRAPLRIDEEKGTFLNAERLFE